MAPIRDSQVRPHPESGSGQAPSPLPPGEGAGGSRGRPRDPEADRLIQQTTLRLLAQLGFAGLSIERVAAESGVAKTTIYRRYKTKIDLVIDAVLSTLNIDETPDTGTLRGDLEWLMNRPQLVEMMSGPGSTLMGSMLAERTRNPELLEAFRQRLVGPRMGQLHRILERATQRGEIREGVDHRLIGHMMFGSLLAHAVSGTPVTAETLTSVIEVLLEGIAARRAKRPRLRHR